MENTILRIKKQPDFRHWLLLFIASSLLGCASAKNITFNPEGIVDPWFRGGGPKIFIREFSDQSEEARKAMGPFPFCNDPYIEELNCPQLFKDAFSKGFQVLGLQVTENINAAQIILNGKILRFDDDKPFVGQVWSGTAEVSLKFLDQKRNLLLETNLSATNTKPNSMNIGGRRVEQINSLIPKLLSQLYAYPDDPSSFSNMFVKVLSQVSDQQTEMASSPASNDLQLSEKQPPQSGTGSGFFVSKLGHVITNAHVVHNCNKVTVGDSANKQVPAEVVNTDRSNDLALLKLSSLEMASAESKSLIQKLSIVVVPLASKGLLRSEDARLGEKVLVAGYPYGDFFSNSIKVTTGVVSSTRGAGDDSGQFQLDAAVQPGNSGGPIYDSSGNIVGVVISQLDKLKVAKAIGSMPENVNFGIKASTVRQFLISSGLPSKKAEQAEEKSTEQLAEIAKNQTLMVMCLQ